MRLYSFYLVFALLAFGIGFGFVYIFTLRDAEIISEPLTHNNFNKVVFINQIEEKLIDEDVDSIECKNKYLVLVWDKLKYKIDSIAGKDCFDYFLVNKVTDINGDGIREIFVRTNLDYSLPKYWVFQSKDNKTFNIILEGRGDIEIKRNKTNGYMNLEASFKIAIEEYNKILFQFAGDSYKSKECWSEIIAGRNKDDQIYMLKKPLKSETSCQDFEPLFKAEPLP